MSNKMEQIICPVGLVFYLIDIISGSAVVGALLVWNMVHGAPVDPGQAAAIAILGPLCFGLVLGVSGIGQPAGWRRARKLLAGGAAVVLTLLALTWLVRMVQVPAGDSRWWSAALALPAFAAAVISTRLGLAAASHSGHFRRRLALVGPGTDERRWPAGEARWGPFEIALAVPSGSNSADALAPDRLRAQRIWAVVATEPGMVPPAVRRRCEDAGVPVLGEADLYEQRFYRVDLEQLPEGWLATARGANEHWLEAVLRRGFDITASLALLLLTLPLLLLTALAIRLDSPGPILYRQERVGRNGRVFMLFKFRSMRVDAEADGKPLWASRQDPRVTRVGRFIRLTRIDEIPQVLNVLRGDMAFIGPRPERPAFVERLAREIPRYKDRGCVKPGITGWAQVNYPYGASVEDARNKLAYDLYYIRHRSLALDLMILVATIRVVLFQEGAR